MVDVDSKVLIEESRKVIEETWKVIARSRISMKKSERLKELFEKEKIKKKQDSDLTKDKRPFPLSVIFSR